MEIAPETSAAILGGLVTGLFAVLTMLISLRRSDNRRKDEEQQSVNNFIQSIHDEIESVLERYQNAVGARVQSLEQGHPFLLFYPVTSEYFTVYKSNANLIGRIQNHDLRRQIIQTYIIGQGLIDSFRMNNQLLTKHELAQRTADLTRDEGDIDWAAAHYNQLVNYGMGLKTLDYDLRESANQLLRMLRKAGALSDIRS